MLGSALEEAHALSVTTRKHMRSVPIEDPLKELERIEEYVRTHAYAQAYAFLRSPPHVQVPHRVKGESGAGYIAGALLLAPIWLLAAPLFLTGVAKSLIPPAPDERLNQRYRLELIDYLAQLKRRVQTELAADAANAEKLAAHLGAFGLQDFTPVRSQTVRKDWETFP